MDAEHNPRGPGGHEPISRQWVLAGFVALILFAALVTHTAG